MKYKYIIFDMDGTLLDTQAALLASIEKGLKEFELKEEYSKKDLEDNWGGDVLKQLIEFVKENSIRAVEREQIIWELTRHYNVEIWDAYVKPFPGITSMLQCLKEQGISLNVYSNSPETIAKPLIEYCFPNIFDYVIGLTDEIKKPDAEILKQLFAEHHVDQSQVLMVGDTMTDYLTAINGGIDFAGAIWDDSPQVWRMTSALNEKMFKTPEGLTEAILK